MRAILLCLMLLAITASCSQEAPSQAPPPFDRQAAIERIKQADFRYSFGLLIAAEQRHSVPLIRERLDAALETRFVGQVDSNESFVIGDEHFHFASIGGTLVRFDSFDTPYFPEEDKFTDEELQQIVDRHTAWIAVDIEHREGGPNEAGAYRLAGRIIEKFADEDTIVIFSASARAIAPWQEELREILRSPNPRAVFGELVGEIAGIDADDEEMNAAIAEAQRRFPEFRQAFTRRGRTGSLFLVKVPFEHATGAEHMWVEVTAITDAAVQGTLANEPYYVETLEKGDAVTIPIPTITDWVYRSGRDTIGGFTMAVLAKRAQQDEQGETGETNTEP